MTDDLKAEYESLLRAHRSLAARTAHLERHVFQSPPIASPAVQATVPVVEATYCGCGAVKSEGRATCGKQACIALLADTLALKVRELAEPLAAEVRAADEAAARVMGAVADEQRTEPEHASPTEPPSADWAPEAPALDRSKFATPADLRAHAVSLLAVPDLWFDTAAEADTFARQADEAADAWEAALTCPYCSEPKDESRGTCGKPECRAARAAAVTAEQEAALAWVHANPLDLRSFSGASSAAVVEEALSSIDGLANELASFPSALHQQIWLVDARERLVEFARRSEALPSPSQAPPGLPEVPAVVPDIPPETQLCPACGLPALPGRTTCGKVDCRQLVAATATPEAARTLPEPITAKDLTEDELRIWADSGVLPARFFEGVRWNESNTDLVLEHTTVGPTLTLGPGSAVSPGPEPGTITTIVGGSESTKP